MDVNQRGGFFLRAIPTATRDHTPVIIIPAFGKGEIATHIHTL
jgi:hypothetical protein